MSVIAKVWIEEDCITCDACQDICPEVFQLTDETSQIVAAVRIDGVFDRNTGGSLLKADFGKEFADYIEEAAEACPVDIIKFEMTGAAAPAAEAAAPIAEVAPTVAVAAAPVAVSAGTSDGLSAVFSGDRTLTILFGSQTGNAAGLAEKTAKLAANYELVANVVDMDGYNPASLIGSKRILIITSTWGEGDMPDNAEDFWQGVNSSSPTLAGVNYSVCAIGDTSYDEYCKAGVDWDQKFSALGATSIQEIQLCDVDFDEPWAAWVKTVLPRIACVDAAGVFHESLVEEMSAYGAGGDDSVSSGDFTPGTVVMDEISVTIELFRYCPSAAQSGWDTISCAVPAHATVEDLLLAIQQDIDGSLAFRRGTNGGTPTTGVRVNGRIVLADLARISDLIGTGGNLKIEPAPGLPIIRDLIVDLSGYEAARARAEPWMRADPREGARLLNGAAVGTMDASLATELHQKSDILSYQLIQSMSDTSSYDKAYEGPGIHLQQWLRAEDPRCGAEQRKNILSSLNETDGVWAEADLSSIARYGSDGKLAARGLNSARAHLLNTSNYGGKHGRLVKWYGRSVKWTGNVNETTLYRQVLGPLGLISNIFNGVSARMVLGFTRNGGPPIRGLQGLLMPPAGVGKIPNMVNSKVDAHHEVVSLFNKIDKRF
ncbi:MAG: flavodoxin domain-containing protein [Candidatus Poseidoniaceae archaeon]|nr:flavodoxin domain-containing protein [Candidatus Poseidoniaceae archaeon]